MTTDAIMLIEFFQKFPKKYPNCTRFVRNCASCCQLVCDTSLLMLARSISLRRLARIPLHRGMCWYLANTLCTVEGKLQARDSLSGATGQPSVAQVAALPAVTERVRARTTLRSTSSMPPAHLTCARLQASAIRPFDPSALASALTPAELSLMVAIRCAGG